jgi:hypothetical protein
MPRVRLLAKEGGSGACLALWSVSSTDVLSSRCTPWPGSWAMGEGGGRRGEMVGIPAVEWWGHQLVPPPRLVSLALCSPFPLAFSSCVWLRWGGACPCSLHCLSHSALPFLPCSTPSHSLPLLLLPTRVLLLSYSPPPRIPLLSGPFLHSAAPRVRFGWLDSRGMGVEPGGGGGKKVEAIGKYG